MIINAALIPIRNSSTRLPNKSLKKIKNDLRSIDIVIKRAKKTKNKEINNSKPKKETKKVISQKRLKYEIEKEIDKHFYLRSNGQYVPYTKTGPQSLIELSYFLSKQ